MTQSEASPHEENSTPAAPAWPLATRRLRAPAGHLLVSDVARLLDCSESKVRRLDGVDLHSVRGEHGVRLFPAAEVHAYADQLRGGKRRNDAPPAIDEGKRDQVLFAGFKAGKSIVDLVIETGYAADVVLESKAKFDSVAAPPKPIAMACAMCHTGAVAAICTGCHNAQLEKVLVDASGTPRVPGKAEDAAAPAPDAMTAPAATDPWGKPLPALHEIWTTQKVTPPTPVPNRLRGTADLPVPERTPEQVQELLAALHDLFDRGHTPEAIASKCDLAPEEIAKAYAAWQRKPKTLNGVTPHGGKAK